jgi:hypothetical protein
LITAPQPIDFDQSGVDRAEMRKARHCAVLAHGISEYAAVASWHFGLRQILGYDHVFPVLATAPPRASLQSFLDHYQVAQIDFASVISSTLGGSSPVVPRDVRRFLELPTTSQEEMSGLLSSALGKSLQTIDAYVSTRPRGVASSMDGSIRKNALMIVSPGSRLLLPAIFYAYATDKTLCTADDEREAATLFDSDSIRSITIVCDAARITKPTIQQLVRRSQRSPHAITLGFLTAASLEAFSALILRLLVLRDPSLNPLFACKDQDGDAGRPTVAMHLVIEEHGGAQHMKFSGDGALCGAMDAELRGSIDFNCEAGCPFEKRIRSNELKAHNLFLLGCETVSFGDGLIPAEFTLTLNALNGWATSVTGPFKHRTGQPLAPLANALVTSGYTLGEIVWRLNGAGGDADEHRDDSCVLVGDPDAAANLEEASDPPSVQVEKSFDQIHVRYASRTRRNAFEVALPADLVDHFPRPTACWLHGFSPEDKVQFTFIRIGAGAGSLIFFSAEGQLPNECAFQLRNAVEIPHALRSRTLRAFDGLAKVAAHGIAPDLVAKVGRGLQVEVRGALPPAGGAIQNVGRDGRPLSAFESHVNARLANARKTLLLSLLADMATRNVWLPNERVVSSVRCLPPRRGRKRCPFCNGATVGWQHENAFRAFSPREVIECLRCGIIADVPRSSRLDVGFDTSDVPMGPIYRQRFRLFNRGRDICRATVLAQFNCWEVQGIAGDAVLQEITVHPHAYADFAVEYFIDLHRPDDVATLQVFVISEEFEIMNYLRKFILRRRKLSELYPEMLDHAHARESEQWVWSGSRFTRPRR